MGFSWFVCAFLLGIGKTMEVSKVLDKGRRVHGGSTRDEVQVEEIPQLSF